MSEVITGVLKFAFGLISNKVLTYGAEKLQDGGLTDQKFWGVIVNDLINIKATLDAISRKDLFTSISCLKEGIDRLHVSFGGSSESGNPSTSELPNAGASSTQMRPAQASATLGDAVALVNDIGKLKIESKERFELAKESFKEAGKKASEAFHTVALRTNERILASKVRIASKILEHLNDPEIAASDCLICLTELHETPAIQKIFSVHIKAGVKSWIKSGFKKDSRAKIVETVTMMNLTLADFISTFTKRRMAVFDWPTITCGQRVVHPIHYDEESLPNLKEMKITPPWDIVVLDEKVYQNIYQTMCAFTKKGDLVCFIHGRRGGPQKLDKTAGKLQPYCLSPLEDNTEHPQRRGKVIGVAVDEDDTVYVLSGNNAVGHTLSVYSADGRNTHHCTLKFLEGLPCDTNINIAVTNDKNIIIGCKPRPENFTVYLCNSNGELIDSFHTGLKDGHRIQSVSVSCNNEIIITKVKPAVLTDPYVLRIYTKDGQLQRTVKFRPSEGDDYYKSIFYNKVTKNITGHVSDCDKILIEYLSDQTHAGLQCSYVLYNTNFPRNIHSFRLVCHTNGALALVYKNNFIFLQKPTS